MSVSMPPLSSAGVPLFHPAVPGPHCPAPPPVLPSRVSLAGADDGVRPQPGEGPALGGDAAEGAGPGGRDRRGRGAAGRHAAEQRGHPGNAAGDGRRHAVAAWEPAEGGSARPPGCDGGRGGAGRAGRGRGAGLVRLRDGGRFRRGVPRRPDDAGTRGGSGADGDPGVPPAGPAPASGGSPAAGVDATPPSRSRLPGSDRRASRSCRPGDRRRP